MKKSEIKEIAESLIEKGYDSRSNNLADIIFEALDKEFDIIERVAEAMVDFEEEQCQPRSKEEYLERIGEF